MTQEMEALAFEGDEGFDLTEEEAEESARLYDEAQVVLYSQKPLQSFCSHRVALLACAQDETSEGTGKW